MTTLTRSQLKGAIEVGIAAAESVEGFAPEHAEALRAVADTASLVARGTYEARDGIIPHGRRVGCPVALAFPDWPDRFTWNQRFTEAYDLASWGALGGQSVRWPDCCVLHITEDNNGEVEAA